MDTENIENVDSVEMHEEEEQVVEPQEAQDEKDLKIQELEEKLKNKAIEARLAKKTAKQKASAPSIELQAVEARVIRAELRAEGIKDDEEIDFVIEKAKILGVEPAVAAKDEVVAALLEKKRKEKLNLLAMPDNQSRNNVNTRDSVEYWIAKGELPPKDQIDLRRQVVKRKRDNSKRAQMFNH